MSVAFVVVIFGLGAVAVLNVIVATEWWLRDRKKRRGQ